MIMIAYFFVSHILFENSISLHFFKSQYTLVKVTVHFVKHTVRCFFGFLAAVGCICAYQDVVQAGQWRQVTDEERPQFIYQFISASFIVLVLSPMVWTW
jgi:hypothetical protein